MAAATSAACACAKRACGRCNVLFNPTPVPVVPTLTDILLDPSLTTDAPLLPSNVPSTKQRQDPNLTDPRTEAARRRSIQQLISGTSTTYDPSDPSNPAPCRVPLGTTVTSCCFQARSPRVRVVIMCTSPCAPLPGYVTPTYGAPVNGPPLTPITAGIPFGLTFSGRPAAYPVFTPPPQDVLSRFGTPAATSSSLVFDFGPIATPSTCGYMQGKGVVLALGAAGAAQASMTFTYSWSRFPQCKTVRQPAFFVDGCTTKGLALVPLETTLYLSTDPCQESVVVLLCQQYCPATQSNATPATVFPCCSPDPIVTCAQLPLPITPVAGSSAATHLDVGDGNYSTEPTACVSSGMNSLYVRSMLPKTTA